MTTTPEAPPATAKEEASPSLGAPWLADPLLALSADMLNDLEGARIANQNRLNQLTRTEPDEDGELRGFGLDNSNPLVARIAALVELLDRADHEATLNLSWLMRRHPLGPWARAQRGIGDKQLARLLAAIGDPYWNTLHDRPRTVSELWAYCGLHVRLVGGDPNQGMLGNQTTYVGVAAARARGTRANWSTAAKTRIYLIAVSCVKQPAGTRWRDVYDAARERYADAVHMVECKRCGPAGKPALPGSPLSAGHQHARGVRLVGKEVLKALWIESRRLHEERGDAR